MYKLTLLSRRTGTGKKHLYVPYIYFVMYVYIPGILLCYVTHVHVEVNICHNHHLYITVALTFDNISSS